MSDLLRRYVLKDVTKGQAHVYDAAHNAYRGTVKQLNGEGLPGRCTGKWGVVHIELNHWANAQDVTPSTTTLVEFQEQTFAGNFQLVFRTRHDAAMFALLTF